MLQIQNYIQRNISHMDMYCLKEIIMNYYTTKALRGPITKINQSDYFIFGPARANIFPVSDRVLSRMIPRASAQVFCLLNQNGGKYERYFS